MNLAECVKTKIGRCKILYAILAKIYHAPLAFAALAKRNFLLFKSHSAFRALLASGKKYELFFIHCLGGGTEVYVKNILRGKTDYIIFRSYNILGIQEIYSLEVCGIKTPMFIGRNDIISLNKIAGAVFVENLCGYGDFEYVLKTIAAFSAKISFKVHDFYSACPKVNMIRNFRYCGVTCDSSCVNDVGGRPYSPEQWRTIWGTFFERVDEFFFFSESSEKILCSIYKIPKEKIKLKPHDMGYFAPKVISNLPKDLNIGIFGSITSEAKGFSVVKSFAEFSRGKDYKIFLNGLICELDLDVFGKNENFVQCGPYKVEEIYDRLVSQKIGVVFFSSVCPETFSYVVSELMLTGIPIACFDVGAQAEKIKKYPLGKIIPDFSNESILKTLRECHAIGREKYDDE